MGSQDKVLQSLGLAAEHLHRLIGHQLDPVGIRAFRANGLIRMGQPLRVILPRPKLVRADKALDGAQAVASMIPGLADKMRRGLGIKTALVVIPRSPEVVFRQQPLVFGIPYRLRNIGRRSQVGPVGIQAVHHLGQNFPGQAVLSRINVKIVHGKLIAFIVPAPQNQAGVLAQFGHHAFGFLAHDA